MHLRVSMPRTRHHVLDKNTLYRPRESLCVNFFSLHYLSLCFSLHYKPVVGVEYDLGLASDSEKFSIKVKEMGRKLIT